MQDTNEKSVGIEFDPEAQQKVAVPLGKREIYPYPGMKVAEVLREQNATIAFGVHGGHIWPVVDAISRIGIKTVTVNHELNAVYMAEAYSQVSRKPGFAFATAGPGMTNTVTGVSQAWLSQSPVFILLGSHDVDGDGQNLSLQEGYASQAMGGMTKSVSRVIHPNSAKQAVVRALQLAQAAPRGPVAIEFTLNMMLTSQAEQDAQAFGSKRKDQQYVPKWRGAETALPISAGAGEPRDIARAVARIQQAQAPVMIFGDGPAWADAGPELAELVSLLKVPFASRRLGRGVVSDQHPCAIKGRVPFAAETDLLIGWGMKINAFDRYGKDWPEMVQIAESIPQIYPFVETSVAIVGNLKAVAQQMVEYVKANGIQAPPGRDGWISQLRQVTDDAARQRREKAMYYGFGHPRYRNNDFCHHGYLSQATADYLQEHYQSSARVMFDGCTISDYATPFIRATRPAQLLNSAEQGGIGHGIGMAIGAMFAQWEQGDRTPILALMGDAGMGLSATEIETAARYKMPIVFMVTNNDGWGPGMKYTYYGKNWDSMGPQDRMGTVWNGALQLGQEKMHVSWANIGRDLGCYAETVRRHEEYLPALHRCFQAAQQGQPAVLDVIVDKLVVSRHIPDVGSAILLAHIPWEETPRRGKAVRRATLTWALPDLQDEPEAELPDPWEPVSADEMEP